MNRNRGNSGMLFILIGGAALVLIVLALAFGGGGGVNKNVPQNNQVQIYGTLSQVQQAAFTRLTQVSSTSPSIYVQGGVVRYLDCDVSLANIAGTNPRARADAFLSEYADLFQIKDPGTQLSYLGSTSDSQGNFFIRYEQDYQGINVFGSDLILNVSNNGKVKSILSGYIPSIAVSVTPMMDVKNIETNLINDSGIKNVQLLSPSSLSIYDPLVFGESTGVSTLVWKIILDGGDSGIPTLYLADADTGGMLLQIPLVDFTINRELREAYGIFNPITNLPLVSTKIADEKSVTTNPIKDADAQAIWNKLQVVYDFFKNNFSWQSYDNNDSLIKAYVHAEYFCPNNAAWVPAINSFLFCPGVVGLDVIAHEFTHGITRSTAKLTNVGEAGALNESYSDVFAAMIDPIAPWIISTEDGGKGFVERNIELLVNPDKPYTMDKYDPKKDIHYNSIIPTLVAYFLTEGTKGKEINGTVVIGLGKQKVQAIYFNALTKRLTSNATFKDARWATILACDSLIGTLGITGQDCAQVDNAFAAVGIGNPSPTNGETPSVVNNTTVTPSLTPSQVITITQPPISYLSSATVLLLDTSGTMQDLDAGGAMSKIQAAQNASNSLLDILAAENQAQAASPHQVAIADFNSSAQVDLSLTSSISDAQNAVNSLYAGGRTAMPDGLKVAIDELVAQSSGNKKIIILLSDGLPNVGINGNFDITSDSQAKQDVLDQAARAEQNGICINTVGFGDPAAGGIDEGFLSDVAAASGCGQYLNARDANQLANVYISLRHSSMGNILIQKTGQISQGQTLDLGTITVPLYQQTLLYTLNWPGSRLDPILVDPKGISVDNNYPGASLELLNSLATIVINNPISGNWQIGANGVDVPEGTTNYNLIISARQGAVPPPTPAPTPIPQVASGGFPLPFIIILLVGAGIGVYVLISASNRRRTNPVSGGGTSRLVLAGIQGEARGLVIPLSGRIVIGRNSACDVQLLDRSVSRSHAAVLPTQGGWIIQDAGSRSGTFVNSRLIRSQKLREGDQIQIGTSIFLFRRSG